MKILYTAFKGKNNTSCILANRLSSNPLLLTNSFQGIERDIASLQDSYDTIYMFGIDKTLEDCVRIELKAEVGGEVRYTELDVSNLCHDMELSSVKCSVSDKPTHYLCNHAYFHMLGRCGNTIFVHIPSVKNMTEEMLDKLHCIFL